MGNKVLILAFKTVHDVNQSDLIMKDEFDVLESEKQGFTLVAIVSFK